MDRTSLLDVQRLQDESAGMPTPDVNIAGIRRATDEDTLARQAVSR